MWQSQGCLLHTFMCVVYFGGGDLWSSIQWQCQGHGSWGAVGQVFDVCKPSGFPPVLMHLGKSLAITHTGMTLPPAPV